MARIIQRKDIDAIISSVDIISEIENAFALYSEGKAVVPPVGELLFNDPKGEVHIKYGYIKGDDFYCVKIASGFYDNPDLGLSSSQGLMLLFSAKTGRIEAVLLDDGMLTDIRTAVAGVIAAKYFAPSQIAAVGIIGTGIQASLQLEYLSKNFSFDKLYIWGRTDDRVDKFYHSISDSYNVEVAKTATDLAGHCNLIVTTTAATQPILKAADIRPGTHITAMGSDTSEKQELNTGILAKADIVVVDSISQSKSRGEVYHAVSNDIISASKVIELGKAIKDESLRRKNDQQITVVDLTGVAVQDIAIAKSVYKNYLNRNK